MSIIKRYRKLEQNKRKTLNTFITVFFGFGWSLIKLLIGLFGQSRFLFASALFTLCLAVSKLLCVIGIVKHEKEHRKILHASSSILIFFGGLFYGLYNTRLLHGEVSTNYGLVLSVLIAFVSFFLFVKAIVFLFKNRQNDDYHRNLRVISFIGGSMDIVLTQLSLLALELPGMNQRYNLYIALGVATATAVLGLYCLVMPYIVRIHREGKNR